MSCHAMLSGLMLDSDGGGSSLRTVSVQTAFHTSCCVCAECRPKLHGESRKCLTIVCKTLRKFDIKCLKKYRLCKKS